MQLKAFTVLSSDSQPFTLESDCVVSVVFDPRVRGVYCAARRVAAIWDTGASYSVISDRLAAELQLPVSSRVKIHTIAGRTRVRTYDVNLSLPGDIDFYNHPVYSGDLPPGIDVLIGMDIITLGDLAITTLSGHPKFTFQLPSTHDFDFQQDLNLLPPPTH
jgi:hypothetical protein